MEVGKPLEWCNYYKGEKECPYSLDTAEACFWNIEETWVKLVNPDEDRRDGFVAEFSMDFPTLLPYIKDCPVSLKATLYNQYCHFYGGKDGFENFIKTYYNKRP